MEISGWITEVIYSHGRYTFQLGHGSVVHASDSMFGFFKRVPRVGEFIVCQVDSKTHWAFSIENRGER